MVTDIVPEMLQSIQDEVKASMAASDMLKAIEGKVKAGTATYSDANDYAVEVGEILSQAYGNHISADTLPGGKMHYNIANRVMNPTLKDTHDTVGDLSAAIQTELNKQSGLGLKGIKPEVDQDRIKGFIERLSSEGNVDDVAWLLKEPVITYSQHTVDETLKQNVSFQAEAGLKPRIVRTAKGAQICDWCAGIAGTYTYPAVPREVYQRHDNCRCTVEYEPGTGRARDVWSKQWRGKSPEELEAIEVRKQIGSEVKVEPKDITTLSKALGNNFPEFKAALDNAPDEVKMMYSKYANTVSAYKKGKGVYHPNAKQVTYDYKHHERYPEMNKYSTLAHEFGHHIDHNADLGASFTEITKLNESVQVEGFNPKFFAQVNSSSDEFLAGMRADKEALAPKLKEILPEIKPLNTTCGLQDALDGMFGLKDSGQVVWGHGNRYYDRLNARISDKALKKFEFQDKVKDAYNEMGLSTTTNNHLKAQLRDYETASETWANIMAADTTGGDELNYMKQYLPNSFAAYKKLLRSAL